MTLRDFLFGRKIRLFSPMALSAVVALALAACSQGADLPPRILTLDAVGTLEQVSRCLNSDEAGAAFPGLKSGRAPAKFGKIKFFRSAGGTSIGIYPHAVEPTEVVVWADHPLTAGQHEMLATCARDVGSDWSPSKAKGREA